MKRITLLSLIIISLVITGVGALEDTHAECTTSLNPYDIDTCLGSGELFLYGSEHVYEDSADTVFTPSYDRLLILTRWTTGDDFWLEQDGAEVPFVLKDESGDPVYARVYEANVTPGVPVTFTSARMISDHQGFISYDSNNGLYNGALESVFEDVWTGMAYLTPGEHSFVYFDKYATHRSGDFDDRLVRISLDGAEVASFTQPSPDQGAIMTTVDIDSKGSYEIEVDSQDSLYWYTFSCPSGLCEDELYCTQTMGGWGSGASGGNVGLLRDDHWGDVIGGDLVIGTGYEMVFTGPEHVENYLPEGGSNFILSADETNPSSGSGSNLHGQLTALQLNILFAEAGYGKTGTSSSITNHLITSGPFAGWTVGDFRDFAFEVFGNTTPAGAYSLSDIQSTADAINNNYVDCTSDDGYLTPVCEEQPYCGDGVVNQESEQCDGDAGVGEHQTCSVTCELEDLTYCGDGVKQSPNDEGADGPLDDGYEACDGTDGVGENEECSASCELIELTYCGDGVKQSPNDVGTGGPLDDGYESCDGTDGVGEHQECTESCELNDLTYCGDGVVQEPNDEGTGGPLDDGYEACDGEAGVGDNQECTASCTITDLTYCGDGVVQEPNDVGTGGPEDDGYEACDGDAGVGENEECSEQCTIVDLPYCGDGVVNQESEQCDGTDGVGEHQSCTDTCELEELTYCGDGVVQEPNDEGTGGPEDDGYEACDGSDGVGENEECTDTCELTNLTYCGDGIVQEPNDVGTGGPGDDGYEACDGSAPEGYSCSVSCELIEDSCKLPGVNHTYTGPVHENMSVYIDTVSRIVIELEENVSSECVDETLVEYDVTYVADEYCQSAQLCAEFEHDVNWSEYEGPFGLDEEGCYVVDYRASDADENATGRACVFHDETPPVLNKTVGEPKEWWDGSNVYYPEAQEWCWSTQDGPECYTLTMGTPVEMSCSETGAEQSGAAKLCFEVGVDGDDYTEQYCATAGGSMESGACCVVSDEYTLYFEEESWHKLSFSCTDHVNKTSEKDVEYFKVEEGSFEIELNKKWNLISVPFRLLNEDMEAVFDGHSDTVISVWGFNGTDWSIYTPDGVDNDDLTQMLPGYGYWVLTRESDTLTIGGSLFSPAITPPSIEIVDGWNLLGYYGTEGRSGYYGPELAHGSYSEPGDQVWCHLNSFASSVLDQDTISVFSYWEPFNPQSWNTHSADEWGLTFTDRMDPGAGYWVQAFGEGVYTPTSTCGTVSG